MAEERTVMFQLPSVLSGTLACIAGTVAGRSWELSAGTFVIGRNDTSDLVLAQEPGVSKTHAKIVAEGDRYVLQDCESRNGTIVNGVPVQRQILKDGDEIRICGCVLRFAQNGGGNAGAVKIRNVDQRMEITDGRQEAPPPARMADVEPAAFDGTLQTEQQGARPMSGGPPPVARGKVLALWYALGLVGSLVFGGTATVVVVLSADPAQAEAELATDAVAKGVAEAEKDPAKAEGDAKEGDVKAASAEKIDDGAVKAAEEKAAAEKAAADKAAAEKATAETAAAERAAAEQAAAEAAEKAKTEEGSSRKRRASTDEDHTPSGGGKTFRATVDGGKSETLRTKGGKVRAVDVKDGEIVSKGQVLVTFDEGENADEIATLRDRIASLEGAEDDDAKRDLKQAKDKLAALTSSKSAPIIAGMAGRITGFSVSPGVVLKSGEIVGRIVEGDAPRRVKVTVDRATKPQKGQDVTLVLKRGGEGVGQVLAISGRTITVETGDLNADEVESVRF